MTALALSRSAFIATALLAGACSHDTDAIELGAVDVSLIGRGRSGTTYRLRDARLAILPTGPILDTEDDPDAPVLSIRLDPGMYGLDLLDGWRLERLEPGGGATTVSATLLSPDPQPFEIVSDEITSLSLRFHVDGGSVGGPGGLDVSLEIEEDAPPTTGTFFYVANRLELPTGSDTRLRLDIDGDGDTENKLGVIIGVIAQQVGGTLDLQRDVDEGVAHGRSILLAALRADATTAFLNTYQGTSPNPPPCAGLDDQVCGGHLQGTATFETGAEGRGMVVGAITSGQLVAGPGTMQIVLPFAAAPLTLDLVSARVRMSGISSVGIGDGIVGGGITVASIQTQVIPWLTSIVQTAVARDCTGSPPPLCGCAAGTAGRTLINMFDRAPVDCAVSTAEVGNSPLVRTLLVPDLDLAPPVGEPDSLSVGFGVTAVRARFTE